MIALLGCLKEKLRDIFRNNTKRKSKGGSAMAKNANYNFSVQKQPSSPMGSGSFANMPEKPMIMKFSEVDGMRDGLVNSLTSSLKDTSKIHENQR